MFEALFGGLFSFVAKAVEVVASVVAKAITGELFSNKISHTETSADTVITDLKDIDKEIADRELSLAKSKSKKDEETLRELMQVRASRYETYEGIRTDQAANDLAHNTEKYSQSKLILGAEHKLQYHLGVAVIKRKCALCSKPMKLQHKNVADPSFNDFFWQCTGFYDDNAQCRNTVSFKASDLSLLHNNDVIELQLNKVDLVTIASEKATQDLTAKRLTGHLGKEDVDVPCPIHFIPMYLREKRGGSALPILDRYHLACTHIGCKQTAKLKSYPQLAAFLRRKEGIGIIH